MTKQYVFWRRPDGKPYTGDDGKHVPKNLLDEVSKITSVNPDGSIGFTGFGFFRFECALRGSFAVFQPDGSELNDQDSSTLLSCAINAAIKARGNANTISPLKVLNEANALAAAHFRKPIVPYWLVTTLSIKSFPRRGIKVGGCSILPLTKGRKRFPFPESLKMLLRSDNLMHHWQTTQYFPIRIKTAGRTQNEAFEQAWNALTLLRGLWNFFATYRQWSMSFGPQANIALAAIHGGPVHTLHTPDGKAAADQYWYDPDFTEDRKLFEPENGWTQIEEHRRWAMRRLRQLPYRPDLERIIIRYADALDQPKPDIAFLHLWSILEYVTGTIGANYDETVKRAVWPFRDHHLAAEMLASLRIRRNRFVHSAKSAQDRDRAATMIKLFVEPHLLNLLRNSFGITHLDEYGRQLALSTDVAALRRQKDMLEQAIRFRNRG